MNQPRTETLTRHCDTCGTTSTERTDYCQSCAKELVRIFPDERTSTQYDDALEIRFSGGYGMYIDATYDVILCKDCANRLRELAPWITELFHG